MEIMDGLRDRTMDFFTVTSCTNACILIITMFSILMLYVRRQPFFELASKFDGPRALPIIGNLHQFSGDTETVLNKIMDLPKSYVFPARIWMGRRLAICYNSPEQIKAIFMNPKLIDKGYFYDQLRPWLGEGLLTAPATKWRVHRKIIQPTFNPKIIQSFIKEFTAQAVNITNDMERHLDGPEFRILDHISQYTVNTLSKTIMGVELDAKPNGKYYTGAVNKVSAIAGERLFKPWLHSDFVFSFTQLYRDQQKYIKFLHDFTDNVIRMRKMQLLQSNSQPDSSNSDNNEFDDFSDAIPKRKTFLDHLLAQTNDNEVFSNEELREEMHVMMFAGSDTIASTSCFLMLMLASHPEVQEKVYQELCEIYVDNDGEELTVTLDNLSRMEYLECVIKETLRLFPPTPLLSRSVPEDTKLDERILPKGSYVILLILDLHRNKNYWPNPQKFDPDRFLPEECAKQSPYTYLPFSGGTRNCIGPKYAMMSMKILAATILRRYILKKDDIVPVGDIRLKFNFVLRPVNPILLKIERRVRKEASI